MKNLLSVGLLLAGLAFTAASCSDTSSTTTSGHEHGTEASTTPTEQTTTTYECPMQCEGSASTKPGKCPVCNMDLVKKS